VGVKFGFLTSREEHRLRVFVSRVVRRIFDVRGRKGQTDTENSVVSFMTVPLHQMLTQLAEGGLCICGV